MLGHPLRDGVSWLFPPLLLLTGWDSLLPTAPWFVGFWVGSAEGDTARGVVRNRPSWPYRGSGSGRHSCWPHHEWPRNRPSFCPFNSQNDNSRGAPGEHAGQKGLGWPATANMDTAKQ